MKNILKFQKITLLALLVPMVVSCKKEVEKTVPSISKTQIELEYSLANDTNFIALYQSYNDKFSIIMENIKSKRSYKDMKSNLSFDNYLIYSLLQKICKNNPELKDLKIEDFNIVFKNARKVIDVRANQKKKYLLAPITLDYPIDYWCEDSCETFIRPKYDERFDNLMNHFIECDDADYYCILNAVNVPEDQRDEYLDTCTYQHSLCYREFTSLEEIIWGEYWTELDHCTRMCILNPPPFLLE